MKKLILLPALTLVIAFTACGPAAEERDQMMTRSKVFQDSIANMIKTSMAEAEAPGPTRVVVPAPTNTAAASTATPAKK